MKIAPIIDAIHNAQVASYINNEQDIASVQTQLDIINEKIS